MEKRDLDALNLNEEIREPGLIEIAPGLLATESQMEALARMYGNQPALERAVEAMEELPTGIRESIFRICVLVAKGRGITEDVLMELKLRPLRNEEGIVYSLQNIETHIEIVGEAVNRLSDLPDQIPAPAKKDSVIPQLKSEPPPPLLEEKMADPKASPEDKQQASEEIIAHETRGFLGFTLKAEELANETVFTLIGRALKAEETLVGMRDEFRELIERLGPVEAEIAPELREKLQIDRRIASLQKLHSYTVQAFGEARAYLNSFHGPIAERLKELMHRHSFRQLEASLAHLEARLNVENRKQESDVRELGQDDSEE